MSNTIPASVPATVRGRMRDRTGLLVVLAALLALSSLHPYPYDNVQTRWALTRGLVERADLSIDPDAHLTDDKALHDGHYYCDKAVMTSLLAAVPYAPLYWLSSALGWAGGDGFGAFSRFLSERLVCTGALVFLLLLLVRHAGSRDERALAPALAIGLGSVLLPYSTLLYGHVPAAAAIFASFHFQRRRRYALADLFGALASAIEFPVFVVFVVLLLYRPRRSWTPGSLARTAGLTLACFLPQLLHNLLAFGNPLTMGYSLEAREAFEHLHSGFFGFTTPRLSTAWMQLLSPERGLLFWMPWAALGFAGLFGGRGPGSVLRRDPRPVCVLAFLLLFSCTEARAGGWASGPRYLIPVIPFLASGLSSFSGSSRRRAFVIAVLLLPAVLQALLSLYGEVHLPVHGTQRPVPLPQVTVAARMLLDGHHSLWLTGATGTAILCALALLFWARYASGTRPSAWALLALAVWALLALPSALSLRSWGGKIAYYRGVLAEHRGEYSLASHCYFEAARDPTAPPEVLERAILLRDVPHADP